MNYGTNGKPKSENEAADETRTSALLYYENADVDNIVLFK